MFFFSCHFSWFLLSFPSTLDSLNFLSDLLSSPTLGAMLRCKHSRQPRAGALQLFRLGWNKRHFRSYWKHVQGQDCLLTAPGNEFSAVLPLMELVICRCPFIHGFSPCWLQRTPPSLLTHFPLYPLHIPTSFPTWPHTFYAGIKHCQRVSMRQARIIGTGGKDKPQSKPAAASGHWGLGNV